MRKPRIKPRWLPILFAALCVGFGLCPYVWAGTPSSAATPTLRAIREDLARRTSTRFEETIRRWERTYGTSAVGPLVDLAGDTKLEDPTRYIAVMGIAKIGGKPAAPLLAPLLKDRSWMIRSASLRALAALGNAEIAPQVLALLKDPALVVRSEAVDAIAKLRPAGAAEALVAALRSPENYHAGKAQWVPQKALVALVALGATDQIEQLRPLLQHDRDPELKRKVEWAMEQLRPGSLKTTKN